MTELDQKTLTTLYEHSPEFRAQYLYIQLKQLYPGCRVSMGRDTVVYFAPDYKKWGENNVGFPIRTVEEAAEIMNRTKELV